MKRQSVSSTNISSVGYDSESHTLEVEFRGSGVYQYFDVPQSIYDALMHASSHGSYFHRHIKDQYRWVEIR
jgi:hypothetical protein